MITIITLVSSRDGFETLKRNLINFEPDWKLGVDLLCLVSNKKLYLECRDFLLENVNRGECRVVLGDSLKDGKENIEDLQSQIAMYRNATTHAGQEKLKSLESQLKDAQRQQQLYELQQSNNKVLTQMQSQYDYLEENKAAKLRELMKSTVDIAKLEVNMSAQIAAAKNALNSDSLRQYNVLRDIYSAIKGLRMGATYTDSRTINNYQGTYNPKGVWSIVNGIAVGGMGSFVF